MAFFSPRRGHVSVHVGVLPFLFFSPRRDHVIARVAPQPCFTQAGWTHWPRSVTSGLGSPRPSANTRSLQPCVVTHDQGIWCCACVVCVPPELYALANTAALPCIVGCGQLFSPRRTHVSARTARGCVCVLRVTSALLHQTGCNHCPSIVTSMLGNPRPHADTRAPQPYVVTHD